MQKLSGKRNEFGRRSGEQLELYRRSNLSGKRTEADIYATFMSVSVFLQFWGLLRYLHCENSTKDIP